MMSDPRRDGKVTLEDLLRLKRAERPATDFWTQFDRDLRTRQLAAAVVKRRWWFGLPRSVARFQMPVGAAAVLAVTFLTLREYREPGVPTSAPEPRAASEVVDRAPAYDEELPAFTVQVAEPPVALGMPVTHVAEVAEAPEAPPHSQTAHRSSRELVATEVPQERLASIDLPLSPSARSIAANLAVVESELPRLLPTAAPVPVASEAMAEPLAQLTSPRDARRERLFAYNDTAPSDWERESSRTVERIGSRISETELYDTVRRLSGGGNHLTLRF